MLESVDKRYRLVGEALAYRVPVEDPLTAQLAHAIRRFNDSLAARDGLEGEWGEVSRRASAAARGLWTIPVEASDELLRLAPTLAFLERWMRVAREVHGDEIAAALGDAVQALGDIVARASSPFREAVVAELRTSPDPVLVIRRGWAAPGVHMSLLADGLDVPVCTPSQLRGLDPVDLVCAVGVTRHLPPSLITAPHGNRVAFVHPSWMNDDESVAGLFGEPGSLKFPIAWEPVPYGVVHLDDLESATDWTAIANQAPDEAEGGEMVDALLMIVAGPRRVFLENERAGALDVVEPRAPQGSRVRREDIGQLEVGDFVLLRDHYGRDDSIRKMADQLLGPDGPSLRETQAAWKQGLRDAVGAKGYGQVSADLVAAGVKARNLRGWLSPDSIRPELAQDFQRTMDYLGLGDKAHQSWDDLGKIDRAHLQAGQRFRKMLEDEIERANLASLLETGEMTVVLDSEGMGSLGIYRVEEIAPDPTTVPASWLRVAQPIDRDLWQG